MKPRRASGVEFPDLSSLRLDVSPMEASRRPPFPNQPGEWQFEPKWDGFRCLAFKDRAAPSS